MQLTPKTERPKLDLGAMAGEKEFVLQRMLSLVETFSALLGNDFDLVDAPCGSTDCKTYFRVPLADPEAYLVLEHEISHPLFGTDLSLTEAFREKAVERLLNRAKIASTHPDAIPYKSKLDAIVHHLWNVLEDHRVRSLWGELYWGGADLLEQRWHDIAQYEMEDQAKKDLITYLGRLAAGVDTSDAPKEFQDCAPHIEKAKKLVARVDNAACLAITARLIDDIADELLKKYPQDPQSTKKQKAQQKLQALSLAISNPGDSGSGHGDNEDNPMGGKDIDTPTGKRPRVTAKQMGQIRKLLTAKDDDGGSGEDGEEGKSTLQKMLDEGAERMFQRLEQARVEMSKPKKSVAQQREEVLLGAAKASGISSSFVTPSQRLPRPTRNAGRLRKHLERVRMQKETRKVWSGNDLDIEALISAKISRSLGQTKLFKQSKPYGGMDLLLLMDVSGSMYGWGLDLLETAVADVVYASEGVKVKIHMWGFSSSLYFFTKTGSPKNVPGMSMSMTHMVQALDAAWEWAKSAKTQRGVLLLTDGFPTTCRARRSTGNAVEDLHSVLTDMKKDNIVVSVLGIGTQNKEYYDSSFGAGRYGLVGSLQDLPKALLDAVRVMIEGHIRS